MRLPFRAMSRDESIYAEPQNFNPERFLTENGELIGDDVEFPFGFGRRQAITHTSGGRSADGGHKIYQDLSRKTFCA